MIRRRRSTRRSSLNSETARLALPERTNTPARGPRLRKLLTIPETAEVLNTSTRTVRRLIESGDLTAHRIGRLVRLSEADILVYLASNRA